MPINTWTSYHDEKEILRIAYEKFPKSYWESMIDDEVYRNDEILNASLPESMEYDLDAGGSIIIWKHDKMYGWSTKTIIQRFRK